jgi:predicted nucleotidyltransferase
MDVLAQVALTRAERDALETFVARLTGALGGDLDAIWLYGSRARGERLHDESDIDVIVLTTAGEKDRTLVWRSALESGDAGLRISPITTTRSWIEERRSIDSFFLQEVDRDKLVLHGEP